MSSEGSVQEQYKEQLRAVARAIDEFLNPDRENKKVGWAILMFPFDCPPGARTNYMSNTERSDMLNSMKEFIARAEGQIRDDEALQ